jgi:hypothetical protein
VPSHTNIPTFGLETHAAQMLVEPLLTFPVAPFAAGRIEVEYRRPL